MDDARSNVIRIWLVWLLVMGLLVAVTWALLMVPLPGGSSGTPSFGDILGYFAFIGVFGTIKLLAVLFLPPIVLTWRQMAKARR